MDTLESGKHETIGIESHSVRDFSTTTSSDLFDKCRRFHTYLDDMRQRGLYAAQFRVTLVGPLDHRIRVQDLATGQIREMICFDSNSYLGLHLHPRVVNATRRVLDEVGYGTPSAQLLGGTNRWLRELEETLCAFYDREAAIVFSSGYAANIGTLTALLGPDDFVARDRFSHASVHDGCRWAACRYGGTFAHRDAEDLRGLLERDQSACRGKLVVTDGVFSMHGDVAPLPDLRRVASDYGALLMVDDAHGLGVLGDHGRGIEEHWGLPGCADVLMGTFSKAPGSIGGYVCGSKELVDYLRFFARSSIFTASLPAALCAGVTESLRVIAEEPEHRERLWRNARHLWTGLRDAGLAVPELESPIIPVFAGEDRLLWSLSRELFDAGIKCGSVCYPAVPRGESLVRISVNARHTLDELNEAVSVFGKRGAQFDILHRDIEEIRAIGRRMQLPDDARRHVD